MPHKQQQEQNKTNKLTKHYSCIPLHGSNPALQNSSQQSAECCNGSWSSAHHFLHTESTDGQADPLVDKIKNAIMTKHLKMVRFGLYHDKAFENGAFWSLS